MVENDAKRFPGYSKCTCTCTEVHFPVGPQILIFSVFTLNWKFSGEPCII